MTREKLLLVDDVPENLQLLYQSLKVEYDIYSARSGAEALKLLETLLPDLILLDVMMPGLDGYQVCARLKTSERLREIPVIFLTALHEEDSEVRGFEAGGVDYITKPLKPTVVQRRVATHLALKRQREELAAGNRQLKEALDRIRVLSGLLPICMTCKKIRDKQGEWWQLETYIISHSDAMFSHGFCPDCLRQVEQELEIDGITT